ncbi:hypothetical protein SAMN05216321_102382 [Cupriavidus sp. OV038]|nr:hypothetical protein SAMN05216321_102382 [Cupriavidus sp. OV038]SFO92871.1 hypothetical protein SAMN05216322_103234 [Cupriavidus sp. OV096]
MVRSRTLPLLRSAAFVLLCMTAALCSARDVRKVVIEEVGQSLPDGDPRTAELCKRFRPTVTQVKNFFSKIYPVQARKVLHDYYSPCYATGTVVFGDSSTGAWSLYSGGTATLVWTHGGDKVYVYYGKNKWYDPFACTYGLEDEGKC